MGSALLILGKDLRLRVRDRSVFLFAFVVPIGLTFLFSMMFPDVDELSVTAAVIDHDGGPIAVAFTDQVLPAVVDAGVLTLEPATDTADAEAALREGDLDAAWVIPEGFSDAVTSGRGGQLEVLVSPEAVLAGEVARGVASSFTTRLEASALAVATTQTVGGSDLDPASIAAQVAEGEPSVALASLVAEDRQLDMPSYLAAGMAAFFVFFTVQYGVTGLLEERQLGTLPRLLAAPIPVWAVQVGKAAGAALLGLVSMAVLAVSSSLLLGADWGPPIGVAVLIVAIVAAAVGLMSLVATFARTGEQAGNYQSIVAIVLGMLGGVFVPLPATSGLLQLAASASPHGWFLRGITEQVASGAWTDALPAAGAIALFGLVAAVPAIWRLRRSATW
ncbi:ABC transporter permease [Nitriliruptor alkaliphilus]|uniref:ABC transporter permease n=1 Tax=Nitriliruptor alkaliphilus TaxID=427918 RepID=UPI00069715FF|nr:ABC transporter permease [Nitriliruptor alkaliphilus]